VLNRRVLAAGLLLVSLALAGCGTGDDSQTAANGPTTTSKQSGSASVTTTAASSKAAPAAVVHIKDDLFDPTKVEIKAGESVTWHWEGKNVHNVDGPGFTSKIQSSGTFTKTFSKAGAFDYRCQVHPTVMMASVVVG
jgi:plastocyanin